MPAADCVTRLFLWSGVVLVLFGLAVALLLGLPMLPPPYLVTGLLALGYAYYCRREARREVSGKP